MKNLKVKLRKIILLTGLTLTGITLYECYSWDIMGKMYSPAPPAPPKQLRVFVTSLNTMGDLAFMSMIPQCIGTGIFNANCACQQLAFNANMAQNGAVYNAWLSDSTTDAICNIIGRKGQKLAQCGGYTTNANYVDVNGNLLFNSWDDIKSGKIPNRPINITENKTTTASLNAWTGTVSGGVGGTSYCPNGTMDWGNLGSGMVGNTQNALYWTTDTLSFGASFGSTACATMTYPIYCFEQP
ncbi:MAG: hypothetical protein OEV78_05325 [Spirochaetia bacterium]|nr:hypothetical protein [Spirochaetia bacterium]